MLVNATFSVGPVRNKENHGGGGGAKLWDSGNEGIVCFERFGLFLQRFVGALM